MSERIPESVIEEAVEAGADSIIGCDLKLKPADGGIMLDADSLAAPIVAATAPVIAAWAREQERERVLRSRLVKSGDEVPAPARWLDGELNKAEARGAAAEKARWEARIEKLATWEDRARAEQGKVARWLEESGSKMAREVRDDEYRHGYTGRVLRSLLTGEGDGE